MGGGCGPVVPNDIELSEPRVYLAATTLTCNGKQFALFGGGRNDVDTYKNDVDVFECNFQKSKTTLSEPRGFLAATTLKCNGKQYSLFGGGQGSNGDSNDMDVFECCDTNCDVEFLKTVNLSQSRRYLAATTMNDCCNKEVALFGGGIGSNGNSNVVDIFDCEDIVG